MFENGFVTECRDTGTRINCADAFLDSAEDSVYCLGCNSSDFVLKNLDFGDSDFAYKDWDTQSRYSFSVTRFATANCKKYKDIISSGSEVYWTHTDRPDAVLDLGFLHSSSFECAECVDGYFLNLDTFQCELRVSSDPLCAVQEDNSNRCKECLPTAFLKRVEGVCELSPNRERNCAVYTSMGLCLACANNTYPVTVVLDESQDRLEGLDRYLPGTYFVENHTYTLTKCKEIISITQKKGSSSQSKESTNENIDTTFKYECQSLPVSSQVPNCVSYDKYKRCHQCAPTHSLFDSKCISIEAQNCAVLHDPFTCRSCPTGYQMDAPLVIGSNLVTSCSEISLDHCEVKDLEQVTQNSTTVTLKVCRQCEKNRFFNSETRTCDQVLDLIENCEYYQDDKTCKFCKKKFLLSNDNTTCQIKLDNYYHGDQNCALGVIQNIPICDACKKGFYLDLDNVCKPCASQGINSVPNNCAICSPRSPNKCLMCAEGYDMNKDGFCQLAVSR